MLPFPFDAFVFGSAASKQLHAVGVMVMAALCRCTSGSQMKGLMLLMEMHIL